VTLTKETNMTREPLAHRIFALICLMPVVWGMGVALGVMLWS
jgi:hypothetical protein